MLKNIKKIIILLIMASMSLTILTYAKENDLYGSKTEEDFVNAKFGTNIGSSLPDRVKEKYPNVSIEYFNALSDVLSALEAGNVDASVSERTSIIDMHRGNKNVKMVETPLAYLKQTFILSKEFCKQDNNTLLNEINEYIKKSKENGFIDSVVRKWSDDYDENMVYNNINIENPKKVLKVAISPSPPYSFVSKGKYVGFDVEIFENFCKEYNYGYKYEYVDFGSVIMGIATNKYDVGIGGISITEERKNNMLFTESHYTENAHVLYYEDDLRENFFKKIKTNFYNSFIKEQRYILILQGLLLTIFITLSSTICGIILGFFMYFIYIYGIKLLNILIDIYVYIMNGIPALVFLMVLYYVVFSDSDISGAVISTIAFSLILGIFVFGALVDYTKIIDKGQVEASLALGYTKMEAYCKVIIPQVVVDIFPLFKNRVIFLLKNTAIVGYIAVQDLTKAGDIIRSRTYTAVFPLLSIAFIYFVVGIFIKALLSAIEKKINPYKRTKEQIMKTF